MVKLQLTSVGTGFHSSILKCGITFNIHFRRHEYKDLNTGKRKQNPRVVMPSLYINASHGTVFAKYQAPETFAPCTNGRLQKCPAILNAIAAIAGDSQPLDFGLIPPEVIP